MTKGPPDRSEGPSCWGYVRRVGAQCSSARTIARHAWPVKVVSRTRPRAKLGELGVELAQRRRRRFARAQCHLARERMPVELRDGGLVFGDASRKEALIAAGRQAHADALAKFGTVTPENARAFIQFQEQRTAELEGN